MSWKKIHQIIKEKILKEYGSRCKQFCISCINCQMHLAMDIIEEATIIQDYDKSN